MIVILINMPILFNSFDKSIILSSEKKPSCFDEESDLFIEVECFNVDPVLKPAPDGLSQHQVLSHSFFSGIFSKTIKELVSK